MATDGTRIAPTVQEGDKVLFAAWGGQEVAIDGDDLLILSERDILAILD